MLLISIFVLAAFTVFYFGKPKQTGLALENNEIVTLTASEDAYVKQSYPSKNYGNTLNLVSDGSPRKTIYIKFDLSAIEGKNISSATLELTPTLKRKVNKTIRLVEDSNWAENTLTWNSRPNLGTEIGKIDQQVIPGEILRLDLTQIVKSSTGKSFSIAIDDTSKGYSLAINSTEASSNAPRLVVIAEKNNSIQNQDQNEGSKSTPQQATNQNTDATTNTQHSTGIITTTASPQTHSNSSAQQPTENTPQSPNQHTEIPDTNWSPYGVYPNCKNGAIGVEDHSWWHEPGEKHPRHVHIAACAPNARDASGNILTVNGDLKITSRIMLWNNPGNLTWVQAGIFQGSAGPNTQPGCGGDAQFCKTYNPNFTCQGSPDEEKECTLYVNMTIPTAYAPHAGLVEMRMRPNIKHEDLNTRQFATLNFQIYVRDGRSESNYRSAPNPIIRSWYTDFEYLNFSLNNYTGLLGPDLSRSIPTVSGVVPLQVNHSKGIFNRVSKLFLDPDFHKHNQGTLLYQETGLKTGVFMWDTRNVPNGVHSLYFQTEDLRTADRGMQASAMKIQVNVRN